MSLARLAAAYCGGIPRGGGRPALQRRHQSRRSRNRPTLESTISREVARKAGQAQVTLGFDLAVSVFRDALCGRRGRRLRHRRGRTCPVTGGLFGVDGHPPPRTWEPVPLSFARVLDAERALTRDRRREAPGPPSRGTRNGGGPASGGWHTWYGCIAGS